MNFNSSGSTVTVPWDFFPFVVLVVYFAVLNYLPAFRKAITELSKVGCGIAAIFFLFSFILAVIDPAGFISNLKSVIYSDLQTALFVAAICKLAVVVSLAVNGLKTDEMFLIGGFGVALDIITFLTKDIPISKTNGRLDAAFITALGVLSLINAVAILLALSFMGFERKRTGAVIASGHGGEHGAEVEEAGETMITEKLSASWITVGIIALVGLVSFGVYYGAPNWQSYFSSEASERNGGARAEAMATPKASPTAKPRVAGAISDEEYNRRLNEAFPNSKEAEAQPTAKPKTTATVPASGKKSCFEGSYGGTSWYYNSSGTKISAELENIPVAILGNPCS